MTTSAVFRQVKDPADNAWYAMTFLGVTLTDATPTVEIVDDGSVDATTGGGIYPTPGDSLTGGPLMSSSAQVVHAPNGDGVAMWLSGGLPGHAYVVRVSVIVTDGSHLFRSAILFVAGQ